MSTWKQDAIDLLEEAQEPLKVSELHKRLADRRKIDIDEVKKHRRAVYEGLRAGPASSLGDGTWVHDKYR